MNDNDVDDLARVLAEHWENPSEFIHAFCHVMAEAVLASPVVVSARDVKALPARLATKLCDCFGPVDDPDEHDDERAGVDAGLALRVLLREPATDAAPTQDAATGLWRCPQCGRYCNRHNAVLVACEPPESGHQRHADATEPADPYPSDPQPATSPQEDAQP